MKYPLKKSAAVLWEDLQEGHVARNFKLSLGAESAPWLIASKKTETYNYRERNAAISHLSLEEDPSSIKEWSSANAFEVALWDPEKGTLLNHTWTPDPQKLKDKLYVLSHEIVGCLICSNRQLIQVLIIFFFWISTITFKLSSLISSIAMKSYILQPESSSSTQN